MPGWKSLPEPYGGFALLVQKTDGNVLQAWLAGSGTPQAAAVESVYDFTVDREYANPLSSARFQERIQEELTEGEQFDLLSLVWLRCTHTRVEVGEPQAGPYGTLECELSEVQLEFSGDGYDGDPAEAPKLHFATGGARRAWTAPGTPLGRLRLRFEQEVTVGTNATPRWTVHERRQLVRQARGQTRVGSVWVEGWELTYTHRRWLADEPKLAEQEVYTVFVTAHPVIAGLAPALRHAPQLGAVWDTAQGIWTHDLLADYHFDRQAFYDDHPYGLVLDRVNDFGDDTWPWLTWPEHLAPHLVTDSE